MPLFHGYRNRADSQSSLVAGLGGSPGLWTPTSVLLSLVSLSVVAAEPVGLGEYAFEHSVETQHPLERKLEANVLQRPSLDQKPLIYKSDFLVHFEKRL